MEGPPCVESPLSKINKNKINGTFVLILILVALVQMALPFLKHNFLLTVPLLFQRNQSEGCGYELEETLNVKRFE